MARPGRLDPGEAAARWRRLLVVLGGVVVLAALGAAASRFSRWWRVPAVPVTAVPAGVLAAMKHGLNPAAGAEVPWGPLNLRPQLNASGELIGTPARPDGNARYFQELGFPWVPGLRQLGSTWADDFASGASVSERRFASPDYIVALIAYYRRRLGDKGMTMAGARSPGCCHGPPPTPASRVKEPSRSGPTTSLSSSRAPAARSPRRSRPAPW
jgi:hypothetical protein